MTLPRPLLFLFLITVSAICYLIAYECPNCGQFGYCWTYNETDCIDCHCPQGFLGNCCEVNAVGNPCDGSPCSATETCNDLGNGLYDCTCATGWTGVDCETEVTPCDSNPCQNGGTCSTKNGTFSCECADKPEKYTGDMCEQIYKCKYCRCQWPSKYGIICENGGTCVQNTEDDYTCLCAEGYTGDNCKTQIAGSEDDPCSDLTCYNGGACVTNSDGEASCLCLSIWTGDNCDIFDACQVPGNECQNNGTCYATSNNTIACNCTCEFEGSRCEHMTDYCFSVPCMWGGNCTTYDCDYHCSCPETTSGYKCQKKKNNCYDDNDDDNDSNSSDSGSKDDDDDDDKNNCQTTDKHATCTDQLHGYSCTCSALYTGADCAMSIYVWNALKQFGTTDIVGLLEQVVSQPSLISNIIPFVLGQLSQEEQSEMSWKYDDLFLWAAYENTELTTADVISTFDITLGNCFTFNHVNSSRQYKLRKAGKQGGFEALMRVREDEYPAWIDTAALLIFPHDQSSTIFAESVRYSAAPGKATTVITNKIQYKLLGGVYGKCVSDVSQVKSYYYTGSYTTSGCLRACYQDAVQDMCNCMDPRYAMPASAKSCSLADWDCVNNVTTVKGDASNWKDCVCPSPCTDLEYDSSYALNTFVYYTAQCNYSATGECYSQYLDEALISVYVPSLTHKVYAESPAMTFNQLISNVGGMGGVFLGISIVTFIEVVMLIVLLCRAFVCKGITTLNKASGD